MNDLFVRTLGEQVTVYDREGKIVKQIPEPSQMQPKLTYFNIVEFEDKLMGIAPDVIPDYYIDIENDPRFRNVVKDPEFRMPATYMDLDNGIDLVYYFLFFIGSIIFGYTVF